MGALQLSLGRTDGFLHYSECGLVKILFRMAFRFGLRLMGSLALLWHDSIMPRLQAESMAQDFKLHHYPRWSRGVF